MKKLLILLLISILCFCGCTQSQKATITDDIITKEDAGLVVHFIDVGQGDSTLLESRGKFALIDGGEYKESTRLISYLSSQGIKELEFIISTHPHSDHCGSLSEIIRNFETKSLICPDVESDSSAWEYVMDAADERGVPYETPYPGKEYSIGAATLTILSPESDSIYSNLNDYSIVCKAEYGNTSFMLTGDAESVIENELLNKNFDLSADILKCGHHGSSSSTSKTFLDAVSPSAAIISCGTDNEYGHPHKETLSALSTRNIPVYRTDTEGTITISSNGEQLYISAGEYSTLPINTVVPPKITYIGNKNSKIFHESSCSSVKSMSDKNKVSFETRQDAIDKGYSPCKSCQP